MNESDQAHLKSTSQGVGARVRRKEDARLLAGRGQFVGDIKLPNMLEVAFVRSPIAHGRLRAVIKPEGYEAQVYTMDDLVGVKPIRAVSALAGFKPSNQWPLARDKVRQVGETIAMCVAGTRAEAEDIASQVIVEIDDLPAVVDMLEARGADPPSLVHEHWGDNVFLHTNIRGDIAGVRARADFVVRREVRTSRQSMAPIEGRGVVCHWDTRL